MGKGVRLMLVLLAALSIVSIFVAFQLYTSREEIKERYLQKEESWKKERASLTKKVSSLGEERFDLKRRNETIQEDLDRLSQELDSWRERYELASKEKQELIERLKEVPRPVEVITKPAAPVIPTPDEYWAAVLKEKAQLEIDLQDLTQAFRDIQIKAEEAEEGKKSLELEMQRLEGVKSELERKLSYNQRVLDSLSMALVREKNNSRTLSEQAEKIRQENFALNQRVKELTSTKMTLAKRLKRLQEEKEILGRRATEIDRILQERLSDIKELKEELQIGTDEEASFEKETEVVELPPIVVKPSIKEDEITAPPLTSKEGRIITINEENNFVVIDLGEDVGLKPGERFGVYRDNTQIATVEVIQVRREISAADIIQSSQAIKIGDLVK